MWGFNRSNRKLDDRDRQRKRDRQTERRARQTDRNSRKLRERVRKREREAEREVERGFIGTAHLSSIDIDEQTDPFTDFSSFQRQEMGRNLIFVFTPMKLEYETLLGVSKLETFEIHSVFFSPFSFKKILIEKIIRNFDLWNSLNSKHSTESGNSRNSRKLLKPKIHIFRSFLF